MLLDLRRCPLRLRGIGCSAGQKPSQHRLYVHIPLEPGGEWNGAVLSYWFAWGREPPADAYGGFLLIPDILPQLVLNSELVSAPFDQPLVEVLVDELIQDVAVARLDRLADDGMNTSPLTLQSALVMDGTQSSGQGGTLRVVLAPGFARALHGGDECNIARVVREAYSFVCSRLGCHDVLASAVIIALQEEFNHGRTEPVGPVITVHPADVESARRGTALWFAEVVRQLGSSVWGAGIRLVGPGALDYQAAIAGALSLAWAESSDSAAFAVLNGEYARLSRTLGLSDWLSVKRGRYRSGWIGRKARRLATLMRDPSHSRSIREATRRYWGRVVPTKLVGIELAASELL